MRAPKALVHMSAEKVVEKKELAETVHQVQYLSDNIAQRRPTAVTRQFSPGETLRADAHAA